MRLIGNKKEFAIEFNITDKTQFMGYAKIWLNNSFITTIYDLIFFDSYLFNYLDELCNSRELSFNLKNKSINNTYSSLLKNLDNEDDEQNSYIYLCGNYPFSDDFTSFSYIENDNIVVLWKPNKNPYFQDVKLLEKLVFHFEMDIEKFRRLANEYIDNIKSFARI